MRANHGRRSRRIPGSAGPKSIDAIEAWPRRAWSHSGLNGGKNHARKWWVAWSAAALCIFTCGLTVSLTAVPQDGHGRFRLESAAFHAGGFIPSKYTCSGDDVSPGLSWMNAPAGTQSLVLIVADPDAPGGTWVHWVVYDMPATAHRLPEGVPKSGEIEGGGRQGTSSFQEVGYGGPCPPPGKAHHYHFKLYALNTRLSLPSGATRERVEQAMKGHILAETGLVGIYKR